MAVERAACEGRRRGSCWRRRWACKLVAGAPAEQSNRPPVPMASYVVGLLRRGPAWTAERTPATDSLQAGHMANIERMAASGKLVGAGPMRDRHELRGVFIFRTDSLAEARVLAEPDPAIRAGRLTLDLHPWYGPAGIGDAYFAAAARDSAYQPRMITLQFGLLRRGPRWTAASTAATRALQADHLAHIDRLVRSGTLAAAGPFTDDGELRGVFVFRADSAEAHRLSLQDPAVRAGRLRVELHRWMVAEGVIP
jgi:uncharacterized protein YciI